MTPRPEDQDQFSKSNKDDKSTKVVIGDGTLKNAGDEHLESDHDIKSKAIKSIKEKFHFPLFVQDLLCGLVNYILSEKVINKPSAAINKGSEAKPLVDNKSRSQGK